MSVISLCRSPQLPLGGIPFLCEAWKWLRELEMSLEPPSTSG